MTKRPLTLLMCDVDHFKECNDKYGHTVGDLILVHITKILKDSFDHAVIGRYGGEEFMVLLPETAKAKAVDLANGLRRAVENAPFAVRREMIRVTVSIGVSSFPDDALDMETLVKKSDEALYEAKRTGRNKVCSSIS